MVDSSVMSVGIGILALLKVQLLLLYVYYLSLHMVEYLIFKLIAVAVVAFFLGLFGYLD